MTSSETLCAGFDVREGLGEGFSARFQHVEMLFFSVWSGAAAIAYQCVLNTLCWMFLRHRCTRFKVICAR